MSRRAVPRHCLIDPLNPPVVLAVEDTLPVVESVVVAAVTGVTIVGSAAGTEISTLETDPRIVMIGAGNVIEIGGTVTVMDEIAFELGGPLLRDCREEDDRRPWDEIFATAEIRHSTSTLNELDASREMVPCQPVRPTRIHHLVPRVIAAGFLAAVIVPEAVAVEIMNVDGELGEVDSTTIGIAIISEVAHTTEVGVATETTVIEETGIPMRTAALPESLETSEMSEIVTEMPPRRGLNAYHASHQHRRRRICLRPPSLLRHPPLDPCPVGNPPWLIFMRLRARRHPQDLGH